MKTLAPALIFLAACSPPPPDLTPITKELASLRQGLEDVKKLSQPRFDTEQAMEDLAKEVRHLRDRLAAPQAAPAPAAAPAPFVGPLSGGVGGTQPGINDLYWVFTKLQFGNDERVVLALYKVAGGTAGFKLAGVRMLTADLQLIEYAGDRPTVKQVLDELKKVK